jgi:hypothetical protein
MDETSTQIDISRIKERVEKMRDIKSEIGSLMSKIDNASKKIQGSIRNSGNTTALQDMTTLSNIPP